MKLVKVLLAILLFYFVGGLIYWIVASYQEKHSAYLADVSQYNKQKMCYECFAGLRDGLCPPIDPYSSITKYPKATEYVRNLSGNYDATLKAYVTEDKFPLQNCIWYSNDSIDKGFTIPEPVESYSAYLMKNRQRAWQGYFFLTLGVPYMFITGTSM